jgi:hypothetical protein
LAISRIDCAFDLSVFTDARNAEAEDLGLLLRGNVARDPGEAFFLRSERRAQTFRTDVRKGCAEQLRRLVGIEYLAGLREDRRGLDASDEQFAVSVNNVRPRCGRLNDRRPVR